MFAVLLRQGFCVPAGFAGVMLGFAAQYAAGALAGCWQLPVCTMLWLSTGLWAKPANRLTMAAAVFLMQLTAAAVTGLSSWYEIAVVALTAAAGAGLSVLYDGAALVGFAMIGYGDLPGEENPAISAGNYCLWRLMIDERWQGRGYGKQAIEKLIEYVRTFPCGSAEYCWLSYDPDNQKARKLYNGFGFMETGEMDGEEAIAALKL